MTPQTPIGRRQMTPLGQARKVVAAVPYSLVYDGSSYVDCGNNASIMDLHSGDFTVDVYWQAPSGLTAYSTYLLLSQGSTDYPGWTLTVRSRAAGKLAFLFVAYFSAESIGVVYPDWTGINYVAGTWYYIRARIASGTGYLSVNASAENSDGKTGIAATSALDLLVGKDGGATPHYLKGSVCYTHIWNTSKGVLASIPTSPLAVDANTAGRWVHSDGEGAILTDTSGNGNNGTITGATWSTSVPAGWTI